MAQHNKPIASRPSAGAGGQRGLFRAQFAASGKPMEEVFAAIEARFPESVYYESPSRFVRGARYAVERSQGEGKWDLFSVGREMYVACSDVVYDQPRLETFAGEGNYEFYVKLSGKLRIELPRGHLDIEGPSCLLLRVDPGIAVRERLESREREVCVSIHCRPKFVRDLMTAARPDGSSAAWEALNSMSGPIAYQHLRLTPSMVACVRSMLGWQHEGRLGLLYKEAKALELVCLVIDAVCGGAARDPVATCCDPRIDRARSILQSSIAEIPNLAEIARTVGVCDSKLKRDFKAQFGKTMFEYSLERRMLVALDLLRSRNLPIRVVATAVGYRHHTSFTAAFQRFFGFLPKSASKECEWDAGADPDGGEFTPHN